MEAQRSLSNSPNSTASRQQNWNSSLRLSLLTTICFIFPSYISFLSVFLNFSASCFSESSCGLLMPLLRRPPESEPGFHLHPASSQCVSRVHLPACPLLLSNRSALGKLGSALWPAGLRGQSTRNGRAVSALERALPWFLT